MRYVARGPRYAIAEDWSAVIDVETNARHPIAEPAVAAAIEAFVKVANGRAKACRTDELKNALAEARERRGLRPAPSFEVIHHFQQRSKRQRATSPLFGRLIRRLGKQGLWWIEL